MNKNPECENPYVRFWVLSSPKPPPKASPPSWPPEM
jgi:hypothetical protein